MRASFLFAVILVALCACQRVVTEGDRGPMGPPGPAGPTGPAGEPGAPGLSVDPFKAGSRLEPKPWYGDDGSIASAGAFYDLERNEVCFVQLISADLSNEWEWRCVPPFARGERFNAWSSPDCGGEYAAGSFTSGAYMYGLVYHVTPDGSLWHRGDNIPEMYTKNDNGVCVKWGGEGPFYEWLYEPWESFEHGSLWQGP